MEKINNEENHVVLIIADISGYTKFMMKTKTDIVLRIFFYF